MVKKPNTTPMKPQKSIAARELGRIMMKKVVKPMVRGKK